MTENFDERRIIRSTALLSDDGSASLGLYFDRGAPVAGELDIRIIAGLRAQLDRCEAWLRDHGATTPAE